jgi:hypothetical protein
MVGPWDVQTHKPTSLRDEDRGAEHRAFGRCSRRPDRCVLQERSQDSTELGARQEFGDAFPGAASEWPDGLRGIFRVTGEVTLGQEALGLLEAVRVPLK